MEDDNLPLRRRIPGAARAGPAQTGQPVLSDSVIMRLQAAVDAAKEAPGVSADEPTTDPIPRIVTTDQTDSKPQASVAREADGHRMAKSNHKTQAKPGRAANPANGKKLRTGLSRLGAGQPGRNPEPSTPPDRTVPRRPDQKRELPPLPRRTVHDGQTDSLASAQPHQKADLGAPPDRTVLRGRDQNSGPLPPPRHTPTAASAQTAAEAARETTKLTESAAAPGSATLPKRAPGESGSRPAGTVSPPAKPAMGKPTPEPGFQANPRPAPPATPTAAPEHPAPQATAPPAPPTAAPGQSAHATAPAAEPETVASPPLAAAEDTAEPETTAPKPVPSKAITPGRRTAPASPARRGPPQRSKTKSARRRRSVTSPLVALAVVALAAAGLVAALVGHSSPPKGNGQLTPLQRLEAANDSQAAAWVMAQVSSGSVVSCDKQMCSALEARGFPRSDVVVLGPTSPYPLHSQLVIETATVRQLFGSSLASGYAPMVLTTVGSGAAKIEIRVIAPDGAAKYKRELAADQASRKRDSVALLQNTSRITTSSQAHTQMTAGEVDERVIVAVAALATAGPIYIVDFGNVATAEDSDVPDRYVDVALSDKASHLSGSAYLSALRNSLAGLPGQYRPMRTQTLTLPGHGTVLRVLFGAPTPLNLG